MASKNDNILNTDDLKLVNKPIIDFKRIKKDEFTISTGEIVSNLDPSYILNIGDTFTLSLPPTLSSTRHKVELISSCFSGTKEGLIIDAQRFMSEPISLEAKLFLANIINYLQGNCEDDKTSESGLPEESDTPE